MNAPPALQAIPDGATPYARVIADSVDPWGRRLTTIEARFHRYVLAEVNTHCVFARNSASSRAIPLKKQLDRVLNHLAVPVSFPLEKPGMQGGEELDEFSRNLAENAWRMASRSAHSFAEFLGGIGVHKSVANRLLEPFMWHTAVISSTAWENFFRQRCSPLAQPELRAVAYMMRDVYERSDPTFLDEGMWHMPYLDEDTILEVTSSHEDGMELLKRISCARVARVSHLTQNGQRDYEEDLNLYDRLVSADPMHASPLEHVARVDPWNVHELEVPLLDGGVAVVNLPKIGKFLGYRQLRHDVELTNGYQSFS